MKTPWKIMTAGDWLVIIPLLVASIIGIAWIAMSPAGSRIVVTSAGETFFVGDLSQNHSVDINGPLGKTHLVIDEQGAYVTTSPCPRKICITMGPAKYSGDLIACVPNEILVRIENNGDEGPYDLLSR